MAESTLCRLCLENNDDLLEIFRNEEDVLRINDVLIHYSIIELKPDDEISNKICTNCWAHIHDFHEFCVRVQKIQESISSIIYVDSKSDRNEVVLANVYDDEDDHILEQKEESTLVMSKVSEMDLVFKEEKEEEGEDQQQQKLQQEDGAKGEGKHSTDKCPFPDIPADVSKASLPIRSKSFRTRPNKYLLDQETDTHNKFVENRKPLTKRTRRKVSKEDESNEKLINSFFNLKCELCQQLYTCFGKLFDHYEVTHKIRGFIMCCGKKYFKTAKIAEHVLWHKKPELFICTKCNLKDVFPDKKHLEEHMITHVDSNSTIFHCEYCEKTFLKKYRYDQHKLTHLRPEDKKYTCQDCAKPYATESLLRVHTRVVHMKSYAHMCEICAKIFKSRVFFEKHQLEHMGQSLPRVQCKICNAWMKNEHTMRAHMRLHNDEGTVHACDLCGKTGPSRNAILKHKRYVHFSERKFKCTLCDKAFKRAVSLKEHMTLHTGEVLYKCTFCTRTFNSGANMFAHKKKMHYAEWKTEKEQKEKEY